MPGAARGVVRVAVFAGCDAAPGNRVSSVTAEGWKIYPRLPGEAGRLEGRLACHVTTRYGSRRLSSSADPAGGDHGVCEIMRIREIEERLDTLTMDILLPLRASKEVDSETINKLYGLVDDLAVELGESADISRRLAGKLWFIFTQMLSEADHTRSPDDILMSAWSYQDRLEKIFGPTFSSADATPGVPRF